MDCYKLTDCCQTCDLCDLGISHFGSAWWRLWLRIRRWWIRRQTKNPDLGRMPAAPNGSVAGDLTVEDRDRAAILLDTEVDVDRLQAAIEALTAAIAAKDAEIAKLIVRAEKAEAQLEATQRRATP